MDLDRVRIAREQPQHARAVAREVLGVVQHEVEPPRAARGEEALERADARGAVQAQRRARPAWKTTCGFGMLRYSPRNQATSARVQRMRPSTRAANATISPGMRAARRVGARPGSR